MGTLFALLVGFCWAAYNLNVRRGMEAMDSGAGYVITLTLGFVANLLWLLLPLPGRGAPMTSWMGLVCFILAGFSTTLLGRWVYFKAVKLLGPSRASAWKNASPLWTLVFGIVLLGEIPGALAIAGTLAIMGGLWFLSREQAASVSAVAGDQVRKAVLLGLASGAAIAAGMLLRKVGQHYWPDPAAGRVIGGASAMLAYMPFAFVKGEV
ncbi:MAG TPA: DMT family transporter, partial [Symbiobacteriaceae bacterium]|nr:DMT family transporter [Symbiobacteriaceae bacterium]